jgi:hypothetical protein
MHFQQDDAPPRYHRDVRKCLNTRFPGRWIGRAAPISPLLSFARSYSAGFFSCGVLSKTECTCHPYLKMSQSSCRRDARDATSHVGRNWIQVGRLPHHKWKAYPNITVRGKTWCDCLPAYSSKYWLRSLYKFIYTFQIVKRLLKHPVFKCDITLRCDPSTSDFRRSHWSQSLLLLPLPLPIPSDTHGPLTC